MKRGEIWWVNFDPAMGSEIRKTRPAVIVSNDMNNRHSSRVQVIPASSNTEKLYPSECFVFVKSRKAKLMGDQIMTVSKERLYEKIGFISDAEMTDLERVLKLQLQL